MGKKWDRLDGVGTGGASFTVDGMGKGFKALPVFGGTPNPLCRNCKGSKRGRDRKGFKVCRCENPDFPNIGREQGRGMQEWHRAWLLEAYRVLEPGGTIKAFGGSRVYHRLAVAMEDAGFQEVRLEAWNYGSGFPKSLDVSKSIDKAAGAMREVVGKNPSPAGKMAAVYMAGNPDTTYGWQGESLLTKAATPEAARWEGWGTALKPGWEPVLVGVKP